MTLKDSLHRIETFNVNLLYFRDSSMSNVNQTKTPNSQMMIRNATSLENAVDKVAANSSTGTEDCSITKLLAKLLAVLLEFAGSLAFTIAHA